MATRRMLHNKISISQQVNSLSLPSMLLFTWMIAHADDDGRLRGEAKYIKATVVPMLTWSVRKIEGLLEEIKSKGLINRWKQNDEYVIELPKWKDHQHLRSDRYKSSSLPHFSSKVVNQTTTNQQPNDNQEAPQYSREEPNLVEIKKSEFRVDTPIADKNTLVRETAREPLINPKNYQPHNEAETATLEAWKSLEPYNPFAFKFTYLRALKLGLPTEMFYQFASEIKQDTTVNNKGAVFNKKVEDYFANKGKSS